MRGKKLLGIVLAITMVIVTMLSCPVISYADSAPQGQSYVVKDGDILWKVATKFGVTWQELAEYNKLKNPHFIWSGQKLHIPNTTKIDILTTNDFHGNLEGGSEAGSAKLAAYMNYYKSLDPMHTVILDGGDAFQGTPVSNVNRGKPVAEVMAKIGYDAMAIGNHEFDWGIDAALASINASNIKVLAANIYEKEKGKPVSWATPYTILNKYGLKIGVIGFSTPETAISSALQNVVNYEFKDPISVANMLIPEVKAKGADIIVLVGHIPGKQDPKTQEITGALADMAKGVAGADAVIGGHSHENVAGIINETPVVEALKNGRMIGHITLTYDRIKKQVVDSKVETIEVRNGTLAVEPSKDAQAIVDKYNKELQPKFAEVIGTAKTEVSTDYNNESPAGNWMADVMREKAETQIAFTNAGGIRDSIPKGSVTLGQVYKVMPFDNTIVKGQMTGTQIKAVLEQGTTLFKGMIQISGLTFTYDSTKPEGQRVLEIKLSDGTPVEMDKSYTVANTDFLSGGQDGFVTFKESKWADTFVVLREALIQYIKTKGEFAPTVEGRIKDVSKTTSAVQLKPAA